MNNELIMLSIDLLISECSMCGKENPTGYVGEKCYECLEFKNELIQEGFFR